VATCHEGKEVEKMNNLKNEVEIEGYVDKLSSSTSIDKYGYEYITFILHYPRSNKRDNFFRCRVINDSALIKKVQLLENNQLIKIKGELIDFMQNGIPKTNILVKELEQI
jgi:hypothetical protein